VVAAGDDLLVERNNRKIGLRLDPGNGDGATGVAAQREAGPGDDRCQRDHPGRACHLLPHLLPLVYGAQLLRPRLHLCCRGRWALLAQRPGDLFRRQDDDGRLEVERAAYDIALDPGERR
jgi:hypothetical protein